jgi:hypothetical protein
MQLTSSPARGRGALLLASRWPVDSEIRISFLDGDSTLQERVKPFAEQWLGKTGARLAFRWAPPGLTDIRISFRYSGSWSLLGTGCRDEKRPEQPTMNFGWLKPDSTDDDVRGVVLHEFGHALGLIHEHMSPFAAIPWDREAVIAELSGPPNKWDRATIESNMFKLYEKEEVRATPFDLLSVMLYPIKRRWTQGGVLATWPHNELSEQDIAIIRDVYA